MADKEAALREAACKGDAATITQLLGEGVAQKGDEAGDTPLLLATSCYLTQPKYVEVVRELLDYGADVNGKNADGNAAIHNTAANGHLEIMELLLENGADFELEGELRMVPLGLAATKKHHAVVNCLVKKLVEDKKFSPKQVEWMNNAENEIQQLHIYRALTAIFVERVALIGLVQFGVIDAIIKGMKKFTKISIQTSALQLLSSAIAIKEGLEAAKTSNVKQAVIDACKEHSGDAVVTHLMNEVIKNL